MLTNPTLEHLKEMKLSGMAEAYLRQCEFPEDASLTFEDRFSLIVDSEWAKRRTKKINSLIKQAGFRQEALPEDIIRKETRKYNPSLLSTLLTTDWIEQGLNLVITGPTGIGKSYIATALGYMACRREQKVLYYRASDLVDEMIMAKNNGTFKKLLKKLGKCELLILDDWGLNDFDVSETAALVDLIDERNLRRSMIIVSQIPIDTWGDMLSDDTRADAIMDRIIKNSYSLELDGPSFRGIEAKKRMEAVTVIDTGTRL